MASYNVKRILKNQLEIQNIFLTKNHALYMAYSMHSEFTLNNHEESIKTDTQMHTNKLPFIRPHCHQHFETTQLSSDLKSLLKPQISV